MRVVELVEDDVVGLVDGNVVEQGDEGELGVVEGQGVDEVGVVVGLGKGKEETPGVGRIPWI